MSRPKKTLERVLTGTSDANIAFTDLCGLLLFLDLLNAYGVAITSSHMKQ